MDDNDEYAAGARPLLRCKPRVRTYIIVCFEFRAGALHEADFFEWLMATRSSHKLSFDSKTSPFKMLRLLFEVNGIPTVT